jgi:hypothetical protein
VKVIRYVVAIISTDIVNHSLLHGSQSFRCHGTTFLGYLTAVLGSLAPSIARQSLRCTRSGQKAAAAFEAFAPFDASAASLPTRGPPGGCGANALSPPPPSSDRTSSSAIA